MPPGHILAWFHLLLENAINGVMLPWKTKALALFTIAWWPLKAKRLLPWCPMHVSSRLGFRLGNCDIHGGEGGWKGTGETQRGWGRRERLAGEGGGEGGREIQLDTSPGIIDRARVLLPFHQISPFDETPDFLPPLHTVMTRNTRLGA
jgi:hypothetical protein